MYASRLEQLGIESTSEIHSTRLKNRIIARIPSIHAYQEGREILLAFYSDIGTALKRSQRDDSDNKASCLAKAASIVRKDMLEKKSWRRHLLGHSRRTARMTPFPNVFTRW